MTTVLQRIDLADRVSLRPAPKLTVTGFAEDTLVRRALEALAREAGVEARWEVRIEKSIPVAAGLGGGSSDAAAALLLANATLPDPIGREALASVARGIGADVPFFLEQGPRLGEEEGAKLSAVDLPQDYWVVLLLPAGQAKRSTAEVYAAFDARAGADGYAERRAALLETLRGAKRATDLAALPMNDLASSPIADELRELGAFRADVSGAGPAVYGLFLHRAPAQRARRALRGRGRTWLTAPAWYV